MDGFANNVAEMGADTAAKARYLVRYPALCCDSASTGQETLPHPVTVAVCAAAKQKICLAWFVSWVCDAMQAF